MPRRWSSDLNRSGLGRWPPFLLSALLNVVGGIASAQPPDLRDTVQPAFDGEYRIVLVEIERRLEADPDDPVLNYYAGICSYFLDETRAAEEYLRKAAEERAPFPEAYYWLARLLAEEEEWLEAREILRSGLDLFPDNEKLRLLDARVSVEEPRAEAGPEE